MDELMKLIEKFAESRHSKNCEPGLYGLDTPDGAYCMCDSTSDAFIRFARTEGYQGELSRYDFSIYPHGVDYAFGQHNPDPTLYSLGKHDSAAYNKSSWHAIVKTSYFYVDFTAKQYHTDACFPHIISLNLAAAAAAGGN
jgi:hypothetical protein